MSIFIILQTLFPLLPFYAIGCLIGIALVHTYVDEDMKMEYYRELWEVKEKAEHDRQESEKVRMESEVYNNIAESLAEDYEAIYYVDISSGQYREFSASERYQSMNVPTHMNNFYLETCVNVAKYVHPDDREFAESMYHKETMLENLEGRSSYLYKYRVMVNGEARMFRFTVLRAKDGKHLLVCEKDVQDEITSESRQSDKHKKHVTFGQIAESLASNYDVIYYVDMLDGNYVGYTSNNIYGELRVNREGDDFYSESRKNLKLILHPSDRERILSIIDKDYLLSSLVVKKQLNVDYRMVVDGVSKYTRMSIRKSTDGSHFIIGVENIDEEVKKEKEHIKALNTEKELARRDELTGTKNKTAYNEQEESVQKNIDNGVDYLPFAIAVCDINDLKKMNDTYGHQAGDEYIKASAKLMCDVFAHSPVFRIGGDEFVIFMSGHDYNNREELLSKLRVQVIENRDKGEGPVLASGLSEFRKGSDTSISEVFERADNEMYKNKKALKEGRETR